MDYKFAVFVNLIDHPTLPCQNPDAERLHPVSRQLYHAVCATLEFLQQGIQAFPQIVRSLSRRFLLHAQLVFRGIKPLSR